jgi:protein SCO1/2
VASSTQHHGSDASPGRHRLGGWRLAALAAVAVAGAAGAGASARILAHGSGSPGGSGLPGGGFGLHRTVPPLHLRTADGRRITLAAFRGKVVVFAPFLTLCSEVCPLTTGAFLQMQHDADAAGVAGRMVFAEISVDPWRDSPARLRAFARRADITFRLLTGTRREVAAFWHFFGIGYRRVPQGQPPAMDWWTHRPLTFDIEHTDALFVIDPTGHEREVMLGIPGGLQGTLTPPLLSLLSTSGRADLANPKAAGWTVAGALRNIGSLLGRTIPARPLE